MKARARAQLLGDRPNAGCKRARIARCLDQDRDGARTRLLSPGNEEPERGNFVRSKEPEVFDYSYHPLRIGISIETQNALTNGCLTRPECARHRLGDDRRLIGISDLGAEIQLVGRERVVFCEPPAIHQYEADRLEVAGRCRIYDRAPRLLARVAVHPKDSGNPDVIQWNTSRYGGLQHARMRLQSFLEHPPILRGLCPGPAGSWIVRRHSHRQHTLWIEPERLIMQTLKRRGEQHRATEEYHGQR